MALPSWLQTVLSLAPSLISIFVPGESGAKLGQVIAQGITDAESIPGATGPEKLQSVLNLTNDAVAGINDVKPGTLNPAGVQTVATDVINTVVATANLIQKHANTPVTGTPTVS